MNLLTFIFFMFLDKILYTFIWLYPKKFMNLINTENSYTSVNCMFYISIIIKIIQFVVLIYYLYIHFPYFNKLDIINKKFLIVGFATLFVGQYLNYNVYKQLKKIGVYYGTKFGLNIPWCYKFPYNISWLKHPQYIGNILTFISIYFIFKSFFYTKLFVLEIILIINIIKEIYMMFLESYL